MHICIPNYRVFNDEKEALAFKERMRLKGKFTKYLKFKAYFTSKFTNATYEVERYKIMYTQHKGAFEEN